MTSVGVIGLGAMGAGMAAVAAARGLPGARVRRARPACAQPFAAEGGVACATPGRTGARSATWSSAWSSMRSRPRRCCSASDGAAAAMQPGSVFVMCSTVDPNWSIALEARLARAGLLYLDAPISGGAAKAASGEMTMMTAGRPRPTPRPATLLDAMAGKVYRLGDRAGAGSKVKIINQLLAGVHIAAAAEAMALGLREGVDAAGAVRGDHAQRRQQLDVREPHGARAGRRLHAAVGGRHLRQGPGPRARHRARDASSRCRWRPPRTRCSCRRRPPATAREDDAAVIKIFPGITLPRQGAEAP